MRCTRLVPESRKYVVVEGRVLYKYLEGTLTIFHSLSLALLQVLSDTLVQRADETLHGT